MAPDPADVRRTNEAVGFCSSLIQIDTTNTGEAATTRGEAAAASFVVDRLTEVAFEPVVFDSAPGRTSVVLRVPGTDPNRDALLVHGHLDTVPADPLDWTFPPFSGRVHDGCVWGRGAVDMKGFVAMTLAVLRSWARSGHRPQRDIVFAWLADEEAGGHLGARWLCREHPELFHRCTEAIGEVGGFSIPISAELTLYPIMTAEKGFAWARVTTEGRSGHGAQPERSNAIADLATIITRVSEHEFPRVRNDATDGYLTEVLTLFGINVDLGDLDRALSSIGPLAALAEPATRNSATPTMLSGGSSPNTRARQATVHLDCRSAGTPISELKQQVETLVGPTATVEWVGHGDPVEAPFRTDLVDTMHRSLLAHDGTAAVVPYMVSAGTDAKAFSSLGIRCYGFSPLQLARGMRFGDLFHGPDERVPIAGLRFGASVLDTFLLDA